MRRVLLCWTARDKDDGSQVNNEADIRKELVSKSLNPDTLTIEMGLLGENGFLHAVAFKHRINPDVVSAFDGKEIEIRTYGGNNYYLQYHTVEVDERLIALNVVQVVGLRNGLLEREPRERVVINESIAAYIKQVDQEANVKDKRIAELESLLAMAAAQLHRQATHSNEP